MRLIDADKIHYWEIDEVGGEYEPYLGAKKEWIDGIPTVKAIPIPEGTTNGDMFMRTYPTSIVAPNKERGLDVTLFLNEAVIFETWFPITWWNAPYESECE